MGVFTYGLIVPGQDCGRKNSRASGTGGQTTLDWKTKSFTTLTFSEKGLSVQSTSCRRSWLQFKEKGRMRNQFYFCHHLEGPVPVFSEKASG